MQNRKMSKRPVRNINFYGQTQIHTHTHTFAHSHQGGIREVTNKRQINASARKNVVAGWLAWRIIILWYESKDDDEWIRCIYVGVYVPIVMTIVIIITMIMMLPIKKRTKKKTPVPSFFMFKE